MIGAQALATVATMMAAFGQPNHDASQHMVSCLASNVWQQGRTASFQRKLQLASDEAAMDYCFEGAAAGSNTLTEIVFNHKRDEQAWSDAVLAALTAIEKAGVNPLEAEEVPAAYQTIAINVQVINASPDEAGNRSEDGDASRAELIAQGNILSFWQATPIMGVDIEPALAILRLAAETSRN